MVLTVQHEEGWRQVARELAALGLWALAFYALLSLALHDARYDPNFGSALGDALARTLKRTFGYQAYAEAYHVFFTPKADCKGLYVARETSSGFEVRELGAGRSSLEFDYRVVVHRKLYRPIPAPAGGDLTKAAVSSRRAS